MTTKRILIAITASIILGTATSAASLEDKPPIKIQTIPDAAFTPDFDPDTAPLDEIRGHARRVFDELWPLAKGMSDQTPEQIEAKDRVLRRLVFNAGRMRDTDLGLEVGEAISDSELRERVLVFIASGHRASRNPDGIEPLLDFTTNGEAIADILDALGEAYSSIGEFDAANSILADPRLDHPAEIRPYQPRRFLLTIHIVRDLALAGQFVRAQQLVRRAELRAEEFIAREPDWTEYAAERLASMYLDARDPESALRLIDSMEHPVRENRLESQLDAVALEQARAGNLAAAATTRARYGSNLTFTMVPLFTEPARDLVRNAQIEQAKRLLQQGVSELLPDGYPLAEVVEIAVVQHELGFAEDARQTIEAIQRLPADPAVLVRIADFESAVGNIEAAKSVLDRAYLGEDAGWASKRYPWLALDIAIRFWRLDDAPKARHYLDIALREAIANLEETGEVGWTDHVTYWLAHIGDTDAALAALDAASELVSGIENKEQRARQYSRISESELDMGLFDRSMKSLERSMRADEREGLKLIETLCEQLAHTGRVSAALELANQVEDPLLRIPILRGIMEIILTVAESRQRNQALQAR